MSRIEKAGRDIVSRFLFARVDDHTGTSPRLCLAMTKFIIHRRFTQTPRMDDSLWFCSLHFP